MRICAIPGGDGFWCQANADTFVNAAKRLRSLGMDDEEIVAFLELLYGAVCDEYGD